MTNPEQPSNPEAPHPVVRLSKDGEWYEATPENTTAWVHEDPDERKFDNIYIEKQDDPEEVPDGVYFWREELGDANFEILMEFMTTRGFDVTLMEEVSEYDRLAYIAEKNGGLKVEEVEEKEPQELTPRQERTVKFLRYVLENEHLKPEDFGDNGDKVQDLYI